MSVREMSSSSKRAAAASVTTIRNVTLGFVVATFAVTAIAAFWWLFLNGGAINAASCDDANVCTNDFAIGVPVSCEHRPATKNVKCSDACYTSGKCDGKGGCASTDPTACKGWCDSINAAVCDNLFIFNGDMVTNFAIPDADLVGTVCFANACEAFVAVYNTQEGVFPLGGPSPPEVRCEDMLDPDFLAANRTCIDIDSQVVDEPYANTYFGNDQFGMRLCNYAWKCSQFNQTVVGALAASLSSTSVNRTSALAARLSSSSNSHKR